MRYKTTFQTPKGTAFLSHQANNGIQPKLNAMCLFYPILFDRCRFRNFSQITVLSAQREEAFCIKRQDASFALAGKCDESRKY